MTRQPESRPTSRQVVVLGGGVAGVEALLAVHDLAGERAELTLVSPTREFVYRPMMVTEPFDLEPPQTRSLEGLTEDLGARFVEQAAGGVRSDEHVLLLHDGSELTYDYLVVCTGGRFRAAFDSARTFPPATGWLDIDEVLRDAEEEGAIAFVVPPGGSWSLPLYELALMTRRRAADRGLEDLRITLITPEEAPLAIFGPTASDAVAKLLSVRGIDVRAGTHARESADGELLLSPGDDPLGTATVIALPTIVGPAIDGLPSDDGGFIPIDEHARVIGADDVYAAGDGTNFPIKQGGLGTQQADAAAAHIAQVLGAADTAAPFDPVLRGKLITSQESLYMRSGPGDGADGSVAGSECLWWPPNKISGRYLAPWFNHSEVYDPEPPAGSLEVNVAMPQEWHEQPQIIDPYR